MPLIDLGIVKKVLGFILVEMPKKESEMMSKTFVKFSKHILIEFDRKPRPFSELTYWKANQLRFFILNAVQLYMC